MSAPRPRRLARSQPLDGPRPAPQHRASRGGSAELIDESYNASPASMRAAFAVLGASEPGKGGRRIAVLGDMLELGDDARRLHAALAEPLAEARHRPRLHRRRRDARALRRAARSDCAAATRRPPPRWPSCSPRRLRAGDVVTVKGSLRQPHGARSWRGCWPAARRRRGEGLSAMLYHLLLRRSPTSSSRSISSAISPSARAARW